MSGVVGFVFLITLLPGLFALVGAASSHYWKKMTK